MEQEMLSGYEESWLDLPEFPGYSVGDCGHILNTKRKVLVRTSLTRQGAVKVGLMKDGKQHTKSVKVLVAEAFVPNSNPIFNTPINLDGDQQNNHADNLVWRPRWFAWKYHNQLEVIDEYRGTGPVIDCKTEVVYDDIASAALANGLLFSEVHMAVSTQIPVFPSWHLFEWE